MRKFRVVSVLGATVLGACSGSQKVAESTPVEATSGGTGTEPGLTNGLGGRLFDDWARELKVEFVPDNPQTPEADGSGGPFGNGTLPDHDGNPMLNTGHDYRLKNLFGWDLRGADGIYGPEYKNKSHVLLPDLLKNTEPREVWIARIEAGEDAIPAFGKVLTRPQIEAVVDFLLDVRDGNLPRPEELFSLSTTAPGNYTLVGEGDAARGHAYYAQSCASCHGAQGTNFLIGSGQHSLGTAMRTEAYETWVKILSGQAGTSMHAQIPGTATHDEATQILQDLNAATCDRSVYPRGEASTEDVPDGDLRCGPHLK